MNECKCDVTPNWLDDASYQAILRETHMIAFEYDVIQKKQRVSPYINEYIAGNYDGRLLSDVMLEDHVIHPDDIAKSLAFREQVVAGKIGEMVIRLLTPAGEYRWFRMVMTRQEPSSKSHLLVGVLSDIDIQMKYQELLRHRAEINPVCGIPNRETFLEMTQQLLGQEKDSSHFLLCFDIERFKLINESFGYEAGDKLLRYVGNVLKDLALPSETFGHLHNDMFSMCIGRSCQDAIILAETITHKIQAYPLSFRFFVPVGIAPVSPGCTDPVNLLCDRAVMAQRRIKGNYLSSYSFYQPFMGAALSREHLLIANMEAALKENQFQVHYQPQYDMRNREVIGAEALARWQHPILGMISPAEFIPLFERNGFIIRLDEYIWEQTCKAIRRWLDNGMRAVPVSVNVSRIHLYNTNFCSKLSSLCQQYDIPRHLLQLELTESAYTERPQELFPVMDYLRQSGFIFAMDDFGNGYSSLNILKDIPISIVKLDLQFLENTRNGTQTGRSILKHIIQLINDLNLSVLAEGVEQEEQIHFLLDAGCNYAQGYYYAKPMPLPELELMLNNSTDK